MEVSIDPVIFSLGPLQVRWYGLMYVVGFLLAGFLLKRLSQAGLFKLEKKKIESLITYLIIGMFIGSRTAYVFIYNWDQYSNNFLEIFSVWKGGLSFHGALVGLAISGYIFARVHKLHVLHLFDYCVVAGTPGLFFGRFGNFINGELYGREVESAVPWGIIFPGAGPNPRHPSQLYEAIFEGGVLFLILWLLRKKFDYSGVLASIFVIVYGIFRYFIEFFREADSQLGYYFGGTTTMGQILCMIMILSGTALLVYCVKTRPSQTP